MVVIPFTYLRPGLWELRCCGDIMSDFLGLSWQQSIQLVVLPNTNTTEVLPFKPTAGLLEAAQTDNQTDSSENLPATSDSDIPVEPIPEPTEVPQLTSLSTQAAIESDENSGVETGEEVSTPSVPVQPISSFAATPLALAQPDVVEQEAVTSERQTPEWESDTVEELENLQPETETTVQADIPLTEVLIDEIDEAQPLLSPTTAEVTTSVEPTKSDEKTKISADTSAPGVTPTNPILDQSLQMLEQILQQVLDPVMQEFEQSEPSEPLIVSEPEQPIEIDTNQPELILTLNEASFVARRGEALAISGQVDVLDVNQFGGSATSRDLKTAFQGSLRYELRDPQTSRVLLDVQQPLTEQALPITFSHALEIPSDCRTRLILGKVTLYGSTSTALATQPFSVTADLEELLGAIIPETRAMPFAKVLVPANDSTVLQDEPGNLPPASALPPQPRVIDLVDVNQSHPSFSLKPSSKSPLPPQIYQPTTNSTTSKKSLQLPKLPKIRPITAAPEFSMPLGEVEQVDSQQADSVKLLLPQVLADYVASVRPTSLAGDTSEETVQKLLPQNGVPQSDNLIAHSDTLEVAEAFASEVDTLEGYDSAVPVAEFPFNSLSPEDDIAEADALVNVTAPSEVLETPEDEELTTESVQEVSQEIDAWAVAVYSADASFDNSDTIHTEIQSTEVSPLGESVVDEVAWDSTAVTTPSGSELEQSQQLASEPLPVDNAFQSLKLQDRFWSRLNSLATDADSSNLLQPELSPSTNSAQGEEIVSSSEEVSVFDVEEVTQPLTSNTLLTDFDETMWEEESETFDGAIAETDPLPAPALSENTVEPAEMPEQQLPLVEIADVDINHIDWAAQEFVVDDDDDDEMLPPALEKPWVQPEASRQVAAIEPPSPQPQPQPQPQIQPQSQREIPLPRRVELPVPAPELSIPTNELAAGEPVTVRVKLPPHPARLCVKLWVQDRQSRYLLDGPRWLMDLIPDRSGEQEALTQLTVPFGSVEIRFEAIAVDIDTQRESHKVALDCVVVPPDLPDLSLDEFDS